MNSLRMVGRNLLVLLFAFVVLTAQASSQSPEQYPSTPGQYEPAAVPPEAADDADDIPAHIAIVDGTATIERDGRVETAEENIMLLAGDRLRTERGRVEVLFADGSALDLDHFTRVDLLSDSLVRLLDGRLRLTIARTTNAIDYRVDAAPGSVGIRTAGDYRIVLGGNRSGEQELDVTVLRGSAELRNALGLTLVRAGTHAAVTASTAPSLPYIANSSSWDEFDRWAEDQRNARYGVESVRYLPEEIRYYGGAFDRYGSWDYLPTYGHVWYPRVDPGWRPYYHGRWSFGARFGWFWVGLDRSWGWPTHHYGRWGFTSNRWYWIPGRRWSPAWVSWAYAPGYVSWCPLGFDNRPVISITNVFVRQPWSGWTVVPSRSFAPNIMVARHALSAQSIAPATWSQFAARANAPVAPAGGFARAQPLRAPTRAYAVPRSGSSGSPAFDGVGNGSGVASGGGGRPSAASAPSRLPSRVPQSRASGSTPRDVRPNPPSIAPATPERALPRAAVPSNESPRPESNGSPSRAFRSAPRPSAPNEPGNVERGSSGLPRNYSPEPRVVTPDRGFRSRVPNSGRTTPSQVAPEPERVQPRGQPWAPRNYSPEPRPSNPEPGGFSRVPRNAAPEPRSSGSGGDRGFRSRMPEPQPQQPAAPPRSSGSPRSEPRSAPPPQEAPQRAAPPSRSAPPPDSGRGGGRQAVRRGRG